MNPRLRLAPSIALALLTLGVYARALGHDFVSYDDLVYVVENPNLRHGFTLEGLWRALLPYEHNWLPLTFLSLLLDFSLYGLHAPGYHATNALLHALSSCLLFAALRRMTGSLGASFVSAAVFAIHPLHVESVAWISERKDALAGCFWMGGLWLYARAVALPRASGLWGVALCLTLGLLAKPVLVSFPFALLLLDYWPLRRLCDAGGRLRSDLALAALREKLPLFGIAAAFCAITWEVQRATGAVNTFSAVPLAFRLENALVSYVSYLRSAVWPSGLAVFYPRPLGGIAAREVAACALLLAALSAAAFSARRRYPMWIVGWLWFLGTLVPMIGIVQVGMHARADRYMYIPLLGLTLALAYSLAPLAGRSRAAARAIAIGAGIALLALSAACVRQLGFWRDSIALYERAIAVTRGNFLAHYGLAGAIAGGASLARVQEQLELTLLHRPGWTLPQQRLIALRAARASLARAQRALDAGDLDAAESRFAEVSNSGFSPPELGLGLAELARARGEPDAARRHLEQALQLAEQTGEREFAERLRRELSRAGGPAADAPRLPAARSAAP